MKKKVSETTALQLDWLVAKCEGFLTDQPWNYQKILITEYYTPSTDWNTAGPLIIKYNIGYLPSGGHRGDQAKAFIYRPSQHDLTFEDGCEYISYGETPLIASMRCLVVSLLGVTVDIPDQLNLNS